MYLRTALWLTIVGSLVRPAFALKPAEIVVIVNRNVAESVALGRFYCDKRKVPPANLVELDLPTADSISQELYDSNLCDPLRAAIATRGLTDRVKCLLTVRGVPFRLQAGAPVPEIQRMLTWYASAAAKAERRLARNLLLLNMVGTHFPPAATPSTEPEEFDTLFTATPEIPAQLPPIAVMKQRFSLLARRKAAELDALDDPAKRAVAAKQIVALFIDSFGLMGWATSVDLVGVNGPPVPGSLKEQRAITEAKLRKLISVKNPGAKTFAQIEQAYIDSRGAVGMHKAVTEMAQGTMNRNNDARAAVDSELSLLFCQGYSRESWRTNSLRWQNFLRKKELERALGGRPVMTARIDGPTVGSVMRMVLDSIAVEAEGLEGTLYVDLGARRPQEFDEGLVNLVRGVKYATEVPVEYDDQDAVFAPGTCPDAALYVGWQSSGEYVPAFTWRRGAVGFHVAMTEAGELRDPNSHQWAPRMLAEGVVATLAAADDPEISAFPTPSGFFALLLSGRLPIVEVYWKTLPQASWRMMLLADPLYNPFANKPHAMELPEAMLRATGAK